MLERPVSGVARPRPCEEHAARLRSLAGAKWLSAYRPVTASRSHHSSGDRVGTRGRPAGDRVTIEATVDAYARLAALAGRASYGLDPCTDEDAADAAHLGAWSAPAWPARRRRGVLVSS